MKRSAILKAWTKYGVPYWYIVVENDAGDTAILCSNLQREVAALRESTTRDYMFDSYEAAEAVLMAAKIRGDVQ